MACHNCENEEIIENGCKDGKGVNASCVIYNPTSASGLLCFIGANKNTSVEYILEELDQKLCNIFDVTLNDCFKEKFDLDDNSLSFSVFFNYLQSYICNIIDTKVKVNPGDTTGGYLNDKIVLGECLNSTIVSDEEGNKKLKISLDFGCISGKIPLCFDIETDSCYEVDCSGCNGNDTCTPQPLLPIINYTVVNAKNVLSCTNCNGNITWVNENNQIIGTGNNLIINGGGTFKAKSITQCGESELSTSLIVPDITTYTVTRTATFTRNNCGQTSCLQNCIGTSISFSKQYSSTISNDHAVSLSEQDVTFNTQGQLKANQDGVCNCPTCNCVIPTHSPFIKTDATCNNVLLNANGTIVINGLQNVNKYSFVINKNTYDGVGYVNATLLGTSYLNASSTSNSIVINSISSEAIYTIRLFNNENDCYKDIIVYMNSPACSGASIVIDSVSVSCEI